MDTHTQDGTTEEVELGADAEDHFRFEEVLEPGEHSIVLTISDGLHQVESEMINITVIPKQDPIWMDPSLDTDNDGMDNLWEYTYHLPWDSDENGQESVTDTNDFDGDGYSDLVEYREGTNPTDVLDFPVESYAGDEKEDSQILGIFDTVWIFLAVLIPIIVLIVAILTLLGFMMQAKSAIKQSEEKEAQEQEALVQNALQSGGRDRLEALKAASEGKGMPSLPMGGPAAQAEGSALPPAQQQEQPAQATPVSQEQAPQPAPVQAQPMQAQPAEGAQQNQYDQNAYNQGAQ
jgi:type II secretory pathway pseudopilin PulG